MAYKIFLCRRRPSHALAGHSIGRARGDTPVTRAKNEPAAAIQADIQPVHPNQDLTRWGASHSAETHVSNSS